MRRRVLGIVLAVVIAGSVGASVPVAGSVSNLAIESATLSIADPAPGERLTVSVSIANYDSSDAYEVTDVYIRDAGRAREHARVENVGTIRPGGQLTVPLSLSFDEVGTRSLTVYARVENETGAHRSVSYPLTVEIEDPDDAVLAFSDVDPVAGQAEQVNVTVSNGEDRPLTNVQLELAGEAEVTNAERVTAALQAGTQAVHDFEVTFADPGTKTLTGTLTYKTADGVTRAIERTVTVGVDPATVDPGLQVTPVESAGRPALSVSLTEYGNAELRDVEVRVVQDGTVLARALAPDVPAEGTRTVTLDGTDIEGGDLTVLATYTAAGSEQSSRTTLTYTPVEAARIVLSGVEASREGSTVTLRGDAANVGSGDLRSVQVAVEPTDGVVPVSPYRDYFIGEIEASEFGTFELTANVSSGATVPARITYVADGERRTQHTQIDVADALREGEETGGGGTGGLALVPIAVAGLLGALLGAGLYRWRT